MNKLLSLDEAVMKWIIHNGRILNPSGDGIRLGNVRGDVEISHMAIEVSGGTAISIDGTADPDVIELDQLMKLLRENLIELQASDRSTAAAILRQVEKDPDPERVPKRLKLLYDMATSVSGSTIAGILRDLLRDLIH